MSKNILVWSLVCFWSVSQVQAKSVFVDKRKLEIDALASAQSCMSAGQIRAELAAIARNDEESRDHRDYAIEKILESLQDLERAPDDTELAELVEAAAQDEQDVYLLGSAFRALSQDRVRDCGDGPECTAFLRSLLTAKHAGLQMTKTSVWAAQELCRRGERDAQAEIEAVLLRYKSRDDSLKLCRMQLDFLDDLAAGKASYWDGLAQEDPLAGRPFHFWVLETLLAHDGGDLELRVLEHALAEQSEDKESFEASRIYSWLGERGSSFEDLQQRGASFELLLNGGILPAGAKARKMDRVADPCANAAASPRESKVEDSLETPKCHSSGGD